MILCVRGRDLRMNEKMPSEQAFDSIRTAWETSGGLSWEFVGQAVVAIIVIAAMAYVAKNAKNFKDKL